MRKDCRLKKKESEAGKDSKTLEANSTEKYVLILSCEDDDDA